VASWRRPLAWGGCHEGLRTLRQDDDLRQLPRAAPRPRSRQSRHLPPVQAAAHLPGLRGEGLRHVVVRLRHVALQLLAGGLLPGREGTHRQDGEAVSPLVVRVLPVLGHGDEASAWAWMVTLALDDSGVTAAGVYVQQVAKHWRVAEYMTGPPIEGMEFYATQPEALAAAEELLRAGEAAKRLQGSNDRRCVHCQGVLVGAPPRCTRCLSFRGGPVIHVKFNTVLMEWRVSLEEDSPEGVSNVSFPVVWVQLASGGYYRVVGEGSRRALAGLERFDTVKEAIDAASEFLRASEARRRLAGTFGRRGTPKEVPSASDEWFHDGD